MLVRCAHAVDVKPVVSEVFSALALVHRSRVFVCAHAERCELVLVRALIS